MNTFYGSVLHIYAFLTHRCLKFQMEASRILRVYGSSSISKELFWSVEFAATFSQISEYHELWQPTPVSLPGESHGQRSLAGYSPWGHKELDMTEHSWTLSTFTDIQAKTDSLWLWRTAQILATPNTSIQISQVILLICHPLPPFF